MFSSPKTNPRSPGVIVNKENERATTIIKPIIAAVVSRAFHIILDIFCHADEGSHGFGDARERDSADKLIQANRGSGERRGQHGSHMVRERDTGRQLDVRHD